MAIALEPTCICVRARVSVEMAKKAKYALVFSERELESAPTRLESHLFKQKA